MAKEKLRQIIKFLADNLKTSGVRVSKIVVFGSQARGDAHRDSDIDLIIISDAFKRKDIFKRARMTGSAEINAIRKFNVPFDILTMTNKEYSGGSTIMARIAKQEGKVFYSAN